MEKSLSLTEHKVLKLKKMIKQRVSDTQVVKQPMERVSAAQVVKQPMLAKELL